MMFKSDAYLISISLCKEYLEIYFSNLIIKKIKNGRFSGS